MSGKSAFSASIAECSTKCHSKKDAENLIAVVSRSGDEESLVYLATGGICANPGRVVDSRGRSVLHVAASVGKCTVVQWLLKYKGAHVNGKDGESGYGALHRALFYGQIHVARMLISKYNANLSLQDHEGLTPLDHLSFSHPRNVEVGHPCDVYVWGTNANYNLGLGHQEARSQPDVIESLRRSRMDISQVCLQKFHSAVVTRSGHVLTFGHGKGGRLGHGNENATLVPCLVKTLGKGVVASVALGVDHSLFLTNLGQVWSCGMNTCNQLGLNMAVAEIQTVPGLVTKKNHGCGVVAGVAAARFHSAYWTKEGNLYTWGLNAGQLGHLQGDRTIGVPKMVTGIRGSQVVNAWASDGATVVQTASGDILALMEYGVKRIARHWHNVVKVQVLGGHLDPHIMPDNLVERGGQDLQAIVLNNCGKLAIWKDGQWTNCLYQSARPLFMIDMCASRDRDQELLMVSNDGSAFRGSLPQKGSCFVKVKRVPCVHRAAKCFCDPKGKNFSLLQTVPYAEVLDFPVVSSQTIRDDMAKLLKSSDQSDIVVKLGTNNSYPCHRYILMCASEKLAQLVQECKEDNVLSIEGIKQDLFEQALLYAYTSSCCDMKSFNNVAVSDMIQKLGLKGMQKKGKSKKDCKFSRKAFPKLHDVVITTQDNVQLAAHRCILAARVEYFQSMFSCSWMNPDNNSSHLDLRYPADVCSVLIDFIYADESPALLAKSDDLEFVGQVLIMADQLLIPRLVEICEEKLTTELMNLKNVTEIIQLAEHCNASQTVRTTTEFICNNVAGLLETKALDCLSEETMLRISNYYRENVLFSHRIITPYSSCFSTDMIEGHFINANLSVQDIFSQEEIMAEQATPVAKKVNRRRKSSSGSSANNSESEDDLSALNNSSLDIEQLEEKVVARQDSSDGKMVCAKSPPESEGEFLAAFFSGVALKKTPPAQTPCGGKKFTRMSQKARKRLNSTDQAEPVPQASPTARWEGWGASSPPTTSELPSLAQIMACEQKACSNNNILTKKDNKKTSKQSWRQLSFEAEEESSSSAVVAAPPQNPWTKSKEDVVVVDLSTFKDILIQEKSQSDNLTRAKSKPLSVTLIEEKAMQDLRNFYSADKVFDECITIERTDQRVLATPIWANK